MKTDDLIDALADRLDPVPPRWMERRLLGLTVLGLIGSGAFLLAMFGVRSDMDAASRTMMFWMKFGYALSLAFAGGLAVLSLGRPGGKGSRGFAVGAAVFGVLAALSLVKFALAPPEAHREMLMGHSALICPWCIVAIGLPALGATLLALRGMAPTRPSLAGAAAGLMAGGLGAFVYAFYCNESAMPFVALWYTLGVAISGALGAVVGRWALRW